MREECHIQKGVLGLLNDTKIGMGGTIPRPIGIATIIQNYNRSTISRGMNTFETNIQQGGWILVRRKIFHKPGKHPLFFFPNYVIGCSRGGLHARLSN